MAENLDKSSKSSLEADNSKLETGLTANPKNNETLAAITSLMANEQMFTHLSIVEIVDDNTICYEGVRVQLDENDIAVVNKLLPHWSEHRLIFDLWQDVDIEHVRKFSEKCVASRKDIEPPYTIEDDTYVDGEFRRGGLVFGHYMVVVDDREPIDIHLQKALIGMYEARLEEGFRQLISMAGSPLVRKIISSPDSL